MIFRFREGEFFIDNLLIRVHFIIAMSGDILVWGHCFRGLVLRYAAAGQDRVQGSGTGLVPRQSFSRLHGDILPCARARWGGEGQGPEKSDTGCKPALGSRCGTGVPR